MLGYRWVLNSQDFKNCTLLLKRLRLPKDIRTYMKKFMYDWVCPCNPVFYGLKVWSVAQAQIYESFQNNPETIAMLPERQGKTTLIIGIAKMCIENGISVRVICSSVANQLKMRDILGRDNEKLVLMLQQSITARDTDVILIDDCDEIESSFILRYIKILKWKRLLCLGKK